SCKVTGKCGSAVTRLVPAPRGTGIVAAPVPKKLLQLAGVTDCYTQAFGSTRTLGNFVKATFAAIGNTWSETKFSMSPYQQFTNFLSKPQEKRRA
ncbi:ribosomal protein S5, C-terminal domain-containing protein, partial [Mortierella sp. GBAus27b]